MMSSVLPTATATPPRRPCHECGLTGICLPAGIEGAELDRIERLIEFQRTLEAGQALFRNGDPLRCIYLVRAGAFRSLVEHEDGSSQILDFHFPGELIGLDAVPGQQHICTVEALQRSRVCVVPWASLQDSAAHIPAVQKQLLRVICRSHAGAYRHIETMGARPALCRLSLFLRELSHRQSSRRQDTDLLQLPMSRLDVGSYIGLAEETVSRLMSRLHADGILVVQHKVVKIIDQAALDGLCEREGSA
jgi:CRP/FNR family transcriptional regulator, anaerobic regulatory protein